MWERLSISFQQPAVGTATYSHVRRTRSRRGFVGVVGAAVVILAPLGLAGCGSGPAQSASAAGSPAADTSAAQTQYPVTVHDCNGIQTYSHAPGRILSLDDASTDTLIALGLTGKIVAVTGDERPSQEWSQDAGIVAKLHNLPKGGGSYPSLETLLALHPDFVTSNYATAFAEGIGSATPQRWKSLGVPTYRDGCGPYRATPQDDFNQLYFDIHNLGVIFDVQDKAASLVKHLQAEVAADQELARNAGLGNYQIGASNAYPDYPGDPLTGPQNAIITEAGSTNAFAKYDNPNSPISKEEFVTANPQVIWLITDQGLTVAQEEHNLQSDPQLKTVRAIRNQAYVPISYFTYAGPRLVDGLRLMVNDLIQLKHDGKL